MFINLEMNPRRYLYLACGTPDQRTLLTSERYSRFKLDIRDKGSWEGKEYWDVLASIPFAFIQEHAPGFAAGPGARMTGNFFKCGDETPYPHFGCWSDIDPIPARSPPSTGRIALEKLYWCNTPQKYRGKSFSLREVTTGTI